MGVWPICDGDGDSVVLDDRPCSGGGSRSVYDRGHGNFLVFFVLRNGEILKMRAHFTCFNSAVVCVVALTASARCSLQFTCPFESVLLPFYCTTTVLLLILLTVV